ncbi:MAG: hypothetical protein EKK37_08665 [Sphingobacteriales bacterium]|nr:MAG: hypothetical protein EKK37_08665 [Sphingobacteriales bacterium]
MRKISSRLFAVALASLIIISSVIVFYSCKKTKTEVEPTQEEVTAKKNSTGKLPGPCPYPCDDPACTGYSDYCGGQTGGQRICGSEFAQFNLANQTLDYVVEYIGTKHNDYQEFLYQNIVADTTVLTNGTLQTFLKQKTTLFMNNLGITSVNNPLPDTFNVLDTSFIVPATYSTAAKNILNQLKTIRNNYTDANYTQTINQLATLRQQAVALISFNEALAVGASVSVASHSYQYWNFNISKWLSLLHVTSGGVNGARHASGTYLKTYPCGMNPKHIAGADISGAVSGGIGGAAVGGIGAFPGAVLGGAVSSSGSVLWEASKCIPYVGGVVKWLEDWF